MTSPARRQLVRDAVRRFSRMPNLTIAKFLVANYPDMFENSVECARSAVRTVVGQNGERARAEVPSHQFRDTVVDIPRTWAAPRDDYRLGAGLWLYMSDIHVPFHRPTPIEAAVEWGHLNGVTGILLNGDVFDYAGVGFWPQEQRDFDKEIEVAIDFLDFLRCQFPEAQIVFKPGNHEYRMPRYFVAKAPELATSPLAAMESVMDFEGRGIEFLQYKQKVRAGGLHILHGDEVRVSAQVNPARGLYLRARVPALIGHCHRSSEHSERDLAGNVVTTWSVGCMCDLSPDFMPYNNWNWGTALIHISDADDDVGGYEVESRRIMHNGKVK